MPPRKDRSQISETSQGGPAGLPAASPWCCSHSQPRFLPAAGGDRRAAAHSRTDLACRSARRRSVPPTVSVPPLSMIVFVQEAVHGADWSRRC